MLFQFVSTKFQSPGFARPLAFIEITCTRCHVVGLKPGAMRLEEHTTYHAATHTTLLNNERS